MKKILRALLLGGLMCLFAAVLCGCGLLEPIENLYALPILPEEYSQLQASIQEAKDELEAEYASINYGNYTSTIQMLDMNGDGFQETAAVFLRVLTSGAEDPLRVCLFQRRADDTYRLLHTIQGDGTSIHSVAYEDLTGDGVREMIVSWQLGANVYQLTAYHLSAEGINELMSTSYNERYLAVDMNGDGSKELVVFQRYPADSGSNRAEYYHLQDGMMVMASSAPLSAELRTVTEARAGRLVDGVDGIYVTCEIEGGYLTDLLVLEETGLHNVTLNPEAGMSQITMRSNTGVSATDIDRDGIIEIPKPVAAASLDPELPSTQHITYWWEFDSQGVGTVSSVTYHSVSDGWYLSLPTDWLGKITVGRDDSRAIFGERAVVFYYWPDTETTTPASFLTIYRLTGDNRYSRSKLNGRTTLFSDNSAIYCASLNPDVWESGVEELDLLTRFNLITIEWSTQ